jgi:adenylosuccinate synthase
MLDLISRHLSLRPSPTPSTAFTSGPPHLNRYGAVIGVVPRPTCVGEGLNTEVFGQLVETLRQIGGEAVRRETACPRRIGWFDFGMPRAQTASPAHAIWNITKFLSSFRPR